MITKEELDLLLLEIEEDRIEKTTSIKDFDKFGEAICAFCNDLPDHRKPGYLLVGVTNEGKRNGLKADENILQNLMDYRTDGRIVPPPSLSVARFKYNDGDVVVVEVLPSFQPPVRYKGKVSV